MSSRKSTPDIMGDLMGGIATKEENHKTIKQELIKDVKPLNTKSIKNALPSSSNPFSHLPEQSIQDSIDSSIDSEELKEKMTIMLPLNLLDDLEDKWMALRKLIGSKQVSKSLIVQISMELALEDFEKNKERSSLYSLIANHKAVKQ